MNPFKKHISFFAVIFTLISLLPFRGWGQVSYIYADSTKLSGRGTGHNELIIENATKNIDGFLYNYGNGRTQFKAAVDTAVKLNDTTTRFFRGAAHFDISTAGGIGTHSIDTVYSIITRTDSIFTITSRNDTVYSTIISSDTIYSITTRTDTLVVNNKFIIPVKDTSDYISPTPGSITFAPSDANYYGYNGTSWACLSCAGSISGGANVNAFQAETDQTLNGIAGPETSATTYTPNLSGTDFLINKGLYQVVRNNIVALHGYDWTFNKTTGTVTFSQPVHDNEIFQFYYASSSSALSGGTDTSEAVTDTSTFATKFGIITIGGDLTVTQKVQITNSFGVYYLRTGVHLNNWNGSDAELDKVAAIGGDSIKVILTVAWKRVEKDGQGNNIPNPFIQPSEYSTFTANLNDLLTKYQDIIEVVVIENEPTTKSYYYGSVLDYIDELDLAIPTVHSYGLPITDGCIHAGYVQNIINGNLGNLNTRQVDTIINHYAALDLDYTNFHTAGMNQPNYNEDLVGIADYVRANNGGKPVMSNEWHVEGAYPSLIQSMVQKMKDAHMAYSVFIDPGTGGGGGLTLHNIGTITLNDLGDVFYDAIH